MEKGVPHAILFFNSTTRCVNLVTDKVVWEGDLPHNLRGIYSLPHEDGSHDLLFSQLSDRGRGSAPNICRGRDGLRLYEFADEPIGNIGRLVLCKDEPHRFFYCLAEQNIHMSARPKKLGYWLLKVDRDAKKVVWKRPIYAGMEPRHAYELAELRFVDIDHDGRSEIITGDIQGTSLMLLAIDATTGETRWEHPLVASFGRDDWPLHRRWPVVDIVQDANRVVLVSLDQDKKNPSKIGQVVCINPANGLELASHPFSMLSGIRSAVIHGNLWLHKLHDQRPDGTFGLSGREVKTYKHTWSVLRYDFDSKTISEEAKLVGASQGVPFDFGLDGSIERLTCQITTSDENAVQKVTIRSPASDKEVFGFQVPVEFVKKGIEHLGDRSYLPGKMQDGEHRWYDLQTSEPAFRYGNGIKSVRIGQQNYPRLMAHEFGTVLVGQTPEGVMSMKLASAQSAVPKRIQMNAPELDSRYRREVIIDSPLTQRRSRIGLKDIVASVGALVLPVWFVITNLRRRSWSLRTLLTAPLVALLCLISWKYVVDSSRYGIDYSRVIFGTAVFLGVVGICYLAVRQHWRTLGVLFVLVLSMTVIAMSLWVASMKLQSPELIPVWTLRGFVLSTIGLFMFLSGPIVLIAGCFGYLKKISNRYLKSRSITA